MDSENLSKLQSVLNSLREAKVPKIFFNLLREFVNELFMNSSYKSMIKKIKNREMETKKRFWSLKTLVLEEMLKIYTNLETYIKKNNLNDSELSIRMKEFTNPPKQYVGRYDFKSLALKKIIIFLTRCQDGKHKKFIADSKHFSKDGSIEEFSIIKSMCSYEEELGNLEYLRITSDWFCLQALEAFFCIDNREEFQRMIRERKEKGLEVEDFIAIKTDLIWGEDFDGYERHFDMDEYKLHAGRVFNSMQQDLIKCVQEEPKLMKEFLFNFYPATSELKIHNDDEPIQYKHDGNPSGLMCLVYKKKKGYLTDTQIYNALFRSDHDKVKKLDTKQKKIISDIIRSFNKPLRLAGKPNMLLCQPNSKNLNERIILISSIYKRR